MSPPFEPVSTEQVSSFLQQLQSSQLSDNAEAQLAEASRQQILAAVKKLVVSPEQPTGVAIHSAWEVFFSIPCNMLGKRTTNLLGIISTDYSSTS